MGQFGHKIDRSTFWAIEFISIDSDGRSLLHHSDQSRPSWSDQISSIDWRWNWAFSKFQNWHSPPPSPSSSIPFLSSALFVFVLCQFSWGTEILRRRMPQREGDSLWPKGPKIQIFWRIFGPVLKYLTIYGQILIILRTMDILGNFLAIFTEITRANFWIFLRHFYHFSPNFGYFCCFSPNFRFNYQISFLLLPLPLLQFCPLAPNFLPILIGVWRLFIVPKFYVYLIL